MPERRTALAHLLRGTEEFLRAASEILAALRERGEERAAGGLEAAAQELADQIGDWLTRGERHAIGALREALGKEVLRWEFRAGDDLAARRVYDLFRLLFEVVGEAEESRPAEAGRRDRPRPRSSETAERAPRARHVGGRADAGRR